MKRFISIFAAFFLMVGLCACSQSEFLELGGFIENYNREQAEQPLNFTDLLVSSNNGQTEYNCFFPCGESGVTVRIFANENKKIEQCRIIVPKLNEKGQALNLTDEVLSLFAMTVKNTLGAYTFCTAEQAQSIVDEFMLNCKETYKNQGELTKEKGSFYFVYLSNSLVSEFVIYNKWLHEIESTNKPVSKVAYADTTKVREETVPLQ